MVVHCIMGNLWKPLKQKQLNILFASSQSRMSKKETLGDVTLKVQFVPLVSNFIVKITTPIKNKMDFNIGVILWC